MRGCLKCDFNVQSCDSCDETKYTKTADGDLFICRAKEEIKNCEKPDK